MAPPRLLARCPHGAPPRTPQGGRMSSLCHFLLFTFVVVIRSLLLPILSPPPFPSCCFSTS
eukprot:2074232-Pyramimonas_sp.AAC.1